MIGPVSSLAAAAASNEHLTSTVTTIVAAADAVSDPVSGFITYGPLGLMIIGFLTGQIVPGWTYRRVEKENDRLRGLVEDKLLPLVEKNTAVTERAIDAIRNAGPRRRT